LREPFVAFFQCQVCQHRIEIDRSSSATKGIVAVKIEPISANEGCTRLWKSEIHFDGIFEGLGVQPHLEEIAKGVANMPISLNHGSGNMPQRQISRSEQRSTSLNPQPPRILLSLYHGRHDRPLAKGIIRVLASFDIGVYVLNLALKKISAGRRPVPPVFVRRESAFFSAKTTGELPGFSGMCY
jgi:hypothetical protein